MRRSLWVVAAIAALGMPSAARAMWADVPLEILAGQSDLVVVGKVVKTGEVEEIRLQEPGQPKPVQTWFRTYTVKVTKLIYQKNPPERAKALAWAGRKIQIVTRAPKPPQPGQPRLFVSDGPMYANLKPTVAYCFILKLMEGGKAFYLPNYPKNARPAGAEWVKQVSGAANVEKWSWGKAVDGLQLALRTSRQKYTLGLSIVRTPRGGQRRVQQIHAQIILALRNTSAKEIAVNLYAEARTLSLKAAGPRGKVVNVDFYSRLAMMDMRAFGAWATKRIAPGEVVFIGPMGEAKYGMGHGLQLTPGKWTLTAGYKNKNAGGQKGNKEEGNPDVPKLWTGAIASGKAEITVAARPVVRR